MNSGGAKQVNKIWDEIKNLPNICRGAGQVAAVLTLTQSEEAP